LASSKAARISPTVASLTVPPRAAVISMDGSWGKILGRVRMNPASTVARINRFFHNG
jgi:hypothetical protein